MIRRSPSAATIRSTLAATGQQLKEQLEQQQELSMEHPRELLPLKEPRRRPGHGATAQSDTEQKSAEALAADRAARGGVRRRTWMLFSFFGGLIYGYNVR